MDYLNKYSIIISRICDRTVLGKKMLQKLMYLMERVGIDLNLNYSIHFFGPYSSMLDNAIHAMAMKDIINIDTSGMTHKITMENFQDIEDNLDELEIKKVDFILDNFSNKSANELEALTTLDYVATVMLRNKGSDEEIIQEVKKIKGSKYTTECLNQGLHILKELSFIK